MAILRNVLSSTTNTNIGKIIRGSTRLDSDRGSYFTRTPSSAGNRRKWTLSVWIKNTNNYEEDVNQTSNYHINAAGTWTPGNQLDAWDLSTSEGTHNVKDSLHWSGGVYGVSTAYNYGSFQSCRDVSGWYNFVIHVDTENGTAADRCITWTNGYKNELKRSGSYNTIAQDRDTMWNNNSIQYLFVSGGPTGYMEGYACEMHHIDGQLIDVSNFGFTDPETGVWTPKKVEISDYGTCGFYLPLDGTGSAAFQDSSNYGEDQSGKGNDWTKNGTMYFTSDSPSGGALSVNNNAGITTTNFPSNYCVWDATSCGNEPLSTLGDGATKFVYNNAAWRKIRGTIPMKAGGKYYFEMRTDTNGSIVQGICNSDCDFTASGQHAGQSNYSGYGIYNNGTAGDAEIVNYSATTSSVWAVADSEILGIALDLSAGTTTGGKLYFYKNGTMLNSAAAWPGGPGQDIDCTRDWWPAVSAYNTGSGGFHAFFGATPFNYMPPDGFLPVCTSNIRPSFVQPNQHVGVATYTGSGGTDYFVSVPFQPDLTWIKQRNGAAWWANADSVRGAGKLFSINDDMAQADDAGSLTAMSGFDKNGFRVGSVGGWYTNSLNDPYVSYNWKAGGNKNTFNIDDTGFSTFADTGISAGSITPTGMSVGKDSGFSIVQYTGNDTSGATVPHGLGSKPAFMIIKGINLEDDFVVYHKSEGATKYGHMNGTGAFGTATDRFNDTEPTDNLFSLGDSGDVNSSSYNYIAWVWAEKPGLSCFTKYKGNGQVLGPEIPMDFLPEITIVKNSSNGSEWSIIDRTRNAYNLANTWISTSSAAAEATPGYYRDLNSNGMKIRDNGSGVNTDNQDYIVMAWAKTPLNATQGSQSTAG